MVDNLSKPDLIDYIRIINRLAKENRLDEVCRIKDDHFYNNPLVYDLLRSVCLFTKLRTVPVVPEEISYLTGYKHWYVGYPRKYSKFHDIICGDYNDCLIIEIPFYMLLNPDIWNGLIDKDFLRDFANFYLEAEKHVPNHIDENDRLYIVHEVYCRNIDIYGSSTNIHGDNETKMLLVFRHFEHCHITELRLLFDLIEYWLGDYADWHLQEFSCNAEGIVLTGYTDPLGHEMFGKHNPAKKLIKHYISAHIIRYGVDIFGGKLWT